MNAVEILRVNKSVVPIFKDAIGWKPYPVTARIPDHSVDSELEVLSPDLFIRLDRLRNLRKILCRKKSNCFAFISSDYSWMRSIYGDLEVMTVSDLYAGFRPWNLKTWIRHIIDHPGPFLKAAKKKNNAQ